MAKGLYLMQDGQVLVDYGKRRVPISRAQYRANGYRPPYDNLPAEGPRKARREFAHAEALKATLEDTRSPPGGGAGKKCLN